MVSRQGLVHLWNTKLSGNTVNCASLEVPEYVQGSYLTPITSLRRVSDYNVLPKQCQYSVAYSTKYYAPLVYGASAINELEALKARVLKATPTPQEGRVAALRRFVLDNFNTIFPNMRNIQPYSLEQYLSITNASPSVKAKIAAAGLELQLKGHSCTSNLPNKLVRKSCVVKAFVKVENNLYHSRERLHKAPRIISSTQPGFIALTGPWHAAAQRVLMKTWGSHFPIIFSSGQSSTSVCDSLFENSTHDILEDDISSFDSSISRELLSLEIEIFKRMGCPKGTLQLMKGMLDTRGVTRHFLYGRPGSRKSGVPYTSSGNSILNAIMHLFLYAEAKGCLNKHDFSAMFRARQIVMTVQGDDNLLTYSPVNINWKDGMLRFGFKADAIPRSQPKEAEFCSSHVVPFQEGYNFVPKLGRIINKFGYFCNPPQYEHPLALLRGVCVGGIAASGGSPFIEQFYATTLAKIDSKFSLSGKYHSYFRSEEHKMRYFKRTPIDDTHFFYLERYYSSQHVFDRFLSIVRATSLGSSYKDDLYQLFCDKDTAAPSWLHTSS